MRDAAARERRLARAAARSTVSDTPFRPANSDARCQLSFFQCCTNAAGGARQRRGVSDFLSQKTIATCSRLQRTRTQRLHLALPQMRKLTGQSGSNVFWREMYARARKKREQGEMGAGCRRASPGRAQAAINSSAARRGRDANDMGERDANKYRSSHRRARGGEIS